MHQMRIKVGGKKLTIRWWGIYTLVGIGAIFSYLTMRSFLIFTPLGDIRVSNLTVNYMLLSAIAGGSTGAYMWKKYTGIKRLIMTVAGSLGAAGLFMLIMTAGGYDSRFF
jgi:hypothetical protein